MVVVIGLSLAAKPILVTVEPERLQHWQREVPVGDLAALEQCPLYSNPALRPSNKRRITRTGPRIPRPVTDPIRLSGNVVMAQGRAALAHPSYYSVSSRDATVGG